MHKHLFLGHLRSLLTVRSALAHKPALALEVGSIALFGLLAEVATILIWRRYWRKDAANMQGQSEISFEDYMLFATIGVETIQYCYLGPALPQWLYRADTYLAVVHWDLEKLLPTSAHLLLITVATSLSAVCVWLCLLVAAGLGLRCGLVQLGYLLLPLLGNVCFLPIVMSLLSLFQCGQAASSEDPGFADTYLLDDCYLRCWSGMHLKLTLPALLALALYVPSSVFLRPKWQEVQVSLHIPLSPAHLMIKSGYQLLVVSCSKALIHHNALAYSVVFSVLTAGYLGASVRWRPYGYGRANLWHWTSVACVLWYSVVVTVSVNVQMKEWVWLCLLGGGGGGLVAAAQLLQLLFFPSQLYRKQGISVVELLRFQFSRNPQAYSQVFNENGSARVFLRAPPNLAQRAIRSQQNSYLVPEAENYDDLSQRRLANT